MAITQMAKILIVSHRSQASELLEELQSEGICQILKAEEAAVSKDWPELAGAAERPKDVEALLSRLEQAIAFLRGYAEAQKGLVSVLAPRVVVNEQSYRTVVSDPKFLDSLDQCEQTKASIEKTETEIENLRSTLEMLAPWAALQTPVEEIGLLRTAVCWAGLLPGQQFEQTAEDIGELGAAIQKIGATANKYACIVASLREGADQVQKTLRSAEFEPVSFESMTGTVDGLIGENREKLQAAEERLQDLKQRAAKLSKNLLDLQILHDHHRNLLSREQTRGAAPTTEHTVILEGWARKKDYGRLKKIVSAFKASSLSRIEPAEGENIPVEIENTRTVRPFESVTRLYGMPQYYNIDPTLFLAPFFALFFALCLTDAGYGLVLIGIILWLMRKMQGDKKMMRMFVVCSVVTLFAGALTGGWFGDTIQKFVPGLIPLRKKMMWFDPIEDPMTFFKLSLALGYFQIIFGICVAFVHNLRRREYVAAAFDQLTWLVMLNSLAVFGLAKAGVLPAALAGVFGPAAAIPAVVIVLFSEREGGWGQRLGMGFYNLFSTVFFVGDILSYARLMALGMVSAGFAMAINVIVEMVAKIKVPVLGIVLAVIIFVGGHLFNAGMSVLSAFVHTLRLQFVEFFPKFFIGGGRSFEPLSKRYEHIYIGKEQ